MTRVTDDLHQMVDCIPDLQNMMMIGLDLFTIIGILILIIGLAILIIIGILILIIGLALLTIIKILIFFVLKRRNGKQERRDPQTSSPLPSKSVKSEKNLPTTLIMNDDQTGIPNLQLNNPMPTTPTSMPYYSDPIVAATHGTPPLTTSVSTAAIPSVSSRSVGESHNSNNTTVRNKGRDVKLVRDITNARDVNLGTSKQTTFNQHTTNFIVCFSDSLKPFV